MLYGEDDMSLPDKTTAHCLFCRIVRGDVPADLLYRGERVLAFADIKPQAPVHILVIPKQHIGSVAELTARHGSLMGEVMLAARQVARDKGLEQTGYRLVVNTGADACQTVPHLHVHVIGGRAMAWPPG